jgi:PAT family beta-lactamase induction signal transducer AmpG
MTIERNIWLVILASGVISGFTLMISGYTLNYWLSAEKIDLKTIGVFSLVTLPYAINFIWAPIFDSCEIRPLAHLGQRLSWIIVIQIALSAAVYGLSFTSPQDDISMLAFISIIVSVLASAQDSVLGAVKTELITRTQQGQVSGSYILGYRIGMLCSSSGAIYISSFIDWQNIYRLFALIILSFPALLYVLMRNIDLSGAPADSRILGEKSNIQNDKKFYNVIGLVQDILRPIGSYIYVTMILLFLILYRLPDNFLATMITPFLHHVGYAAIEIATNGKLLGTLSAIVGGLIASQIMKKQSLYKSLLYFGIIHALTHVLYIAIYYYGKNNYILCSVTIAEGITGGMGMAGYIAFISASCNGKYRATQYSFFSSMMGLSRSVLPTFSGYIVAHFNWPIFFCLMSLASMPALILLIYLEKNTKK